MALRHSNTGVQFMLVNFADTQCQWEGFQPASMGARTFRLAPRGPGAWSASIHENTYSLRGDRLSMLRL